MKHTKPSTSERVEKAADELADSASKAAALIDMLDEHHRTDVADLTEIGPKGLEQLSDHLWGSFHALKLAAADLNAKSDALRECRRRARAQRAEA
jgi:hypothetical protein